VTVAGVLAHHEGTPTTLFEFDPSVLTWDPIETRDQIEVRWDLNGDGIWEFDWLDGQTAAQSVTWSYAEPAIHRAILEARSSYSELNGRAEVFVEVVSP